jgi:tRNA A37 threonylcarbamoyladenosine dehydratase
VAGHPVAVAVAGVAGDGDPQEVKIGDISRSHEK